MRRMTAPMTALAVVALLTAPALADGAGRHFKVSADAHTPNEASFTSRAAIVKFTGRTDKVTGDLKIDENNTTKASGSVTVNVASLDTGIKLRNEHMQGTISADKYPTATFKVQKLTVPGNKLKTNAVTEGTVTGQMTLHGVTRTLTAPVELTYLPEQDANYRPGDWIEVNTRFKLKLSDYKIPLPAPVMGVKVADELEIGFTSMAKAL